MRLKHIVVGGFVVALAGAARASDEIFFGLSGQGPDQFFGRSVAGVGDVNGDGVPDFAVGAPGVSAGYVTVFSGKDKSTLHYWSSSVGFGSSVAGVGDVNGDQVPDIVVGGYGTAIVFSGKTGDILYVKNDMSGWLGYSVAGVGDVDKDGRADFVIGAPLGSAAGLTSNGYVNLYSGKTGALLHQWAGSASGENFGHAVAAGGDVNNDGFRDVLVTAPQYTFLGGECGKVEVFSGKDYSSIFSRSGLNDTQFGWSIAGDLDVNGDGFPDLVVGAPNEQGSAPYTGSVRVFSGKTSSLLYVLYGASKNAGMGTSVTGMGDVNGDGHDDFATGSPGDVFAPYWYGTVAVVSGYDGNQIHSYNGSSSSFAFGGAVAGMGDVNSDGRVDLLIGDHGNSYSFPSAGAAWLCSTVAYSPAWSNYGAGWSGQNGVPALTMTIAPAICSQAQITLSNSAGMSTVAALFLGTSQAYIPTGWGGHVLVAAPWSIFLEALPTKGLVLSLDVPCDSTIVGAKVYLQALESDQGATQGVSFTPGMEVVFGL